MRSRSLWPSCRLTYSLYSLRFTSSWPCSARTINSQESQPRGERSKEMDTLAMLLPMLALLQASGDVTMIGVGIAAGTAVIGPGAGMGYLIGQTIASIHRQPEAFEQTRTLMFLGIGLVEAFALYGIVFALLIAFVL